MITTSNASTAATARGGAVKRDGDTGEPVETDVISDLRPPPDTPCPVTAVERSPLRRPAHQRNVQCVQQTLDTCAELLDEIEYSELSTTRVVNRAAVAIGSVYQLLPDTFGTWVTTRLHRGRPVHWTEATEVVIGEYNARRNTPGFRGPHLGGIVSVRPLNANADNNQVIATRLRELPISTTSVDDNDSLRYASMAAVETTNVVLKLAFHHDPDSDPRLIEEAKHPVCCYLSRRFPLTSTFGQARGELRGTPE